MDQTTIQAAYDRLSSRALVLGGTLPEWAQRKVSSWARGEWLIYNDFIVSHLPVSPRGLAVLDYGGGYGLLAPLLLAYGASSVVSLDVLDVPPTLHKDNRISFVKPEGPRIPLQPETVGLVIMNEVISHVQPSWLPLVYDEVLRVLSPGGVLFLSDGNSLDDAKYVKETLLPLYEAIENGPDGACSAVGVCYRNRRRDAAILAGVPAPEAEDFAANTASLWGDEFRRVLADFCSSRRLIRRPYRVGDAPTETETGVVQERGFYPLQVALTLKQHGFVRCECFTEPYRRMAPWTGRNITSSFPSANFFVAASKPLA